MLVTRHPLARRMPREELASADIDLVEGAPMGMVRSVDADHARSIGGRLGAASGVAAAGLVAGLPVGVLLSDQGMLAEPGAGAVPAWALFLGFVVAVGAVLGLALGPRPRGFAAAASGGLLVGTAGLAGLVPHRRTGDARAGAELVDRGCRSRVPLPGRRPVARWSDRGVAAGTGLAAAGFPAIGRGDRVPGRPLRGWSSSAAGSAG